MSELLKYGEHETLLVDQPRMLGLELLKAANRGSAVCFGAKDPAKYYREKLTEGARSKGSDPKDYEPEALLMAIEAFSMQSGIAKEGEREVVCSVNIHDSKERLKFLNGIMNRTNGEYNFIDSSVETLEYTSDVSGFPTILEFIDEPSNPNNLVYLKTRKPGTL